MIYRELGSTGIKVSVIGFGAWGIGGEPFWKSKGDAASVEAVEIAFDNGMNFFDTAPVYGFGHSEELIGRTFKNRRDKVVIATKCGLVWTENNMRSIKKILKPDSIRQEVEKSLKRLMTDYIDLYQIHWPSDDDPPEPALEEMAKMKKEGKIRAIGLSNFDADLLRRAVKVTQIDSLQPKYNMIERDAENELLPLCGENNIGVLAYSPLASGLLTGKYSPDTRFDDWRSGSMGIFRKETLAAAYHKLEKLQSAASRMGRTLTHLAINWVIAGPNVTSALVGVKDEAQLRENLACLEENPLTEEELRDVENSF
ncbi:MAG: oxidoreductase [bacterium]|nr:MAG: oxidoreductase [bacterium]